MSGHETNRPPAAETETIRAFLRALHEPGIVVEVRVPKAGRAGTISGYFDDHDALAREAAKLSGRAAGVYVTLNPANPALLARAVNRVRERAESTTADHDIQQRRWLFLDFDPARPSGIASTEEEHEAALRMAKKCAAQMRGRGWAAPVMVDSGNGAALYWRLDLPNDDASRRLVERALQALDLLFSDEVVHVDTSVANAARIVRVPGTLNAKGDSTADRPHRLARLLDVPDEIEVVAHKQLFELAAMLPEPEAQQRRVGATAFDLERWIGEHGVEARGPQPWQGGRKWILRRCPFSADHEDGAAYIAQFSSGAISAGCRHNSCRGKRWADLRALYEPDAHARPASAPLGHGDHLVQRPTAEPGAGGDVPPLAELLDAVKDFVRRYVVLSEPQGVALALWVAHTHAFEAAETTPYISINSAEKRSGKTRLLEALSLLVANAWLTGRVTAAVLVRRIARDLPTLLLDESDAAFKGDKEYSEALRGILNSGHRRGGVASLCVGRNFEPTDFMVFSPKAIAGIGRLPDTVTDRSIPVELKRRRAGEAVERFRRRDVELIASPTWEALARWAAGAIEQLSEARPALPDELDDRAADGWEPLLAIADMAGDAWPQRARAAAIALSAGRSDEDDSLGVRVLADVRRVFDESGSDRETSADLVSALVAMEEAPWGDLRGKPLDERALARLLRPYGVRPKSTRLADREKTLKGYRREELVDAWERYVPVAGRPRGAAQPAQPAHPGNPNLPSVTDVPLVPVPTGRLAGVCADCGRPTTESIGMCAECEVREIRFHRLGKPLAKAAGNGR